MFGSNRQEQKGRDRQPPQAVTGPYNQSIDNSPKAAQKPIAKSHSDHPTERVAAATPPSLGQRIYNSVSAVLSSNNFYTSVSNIIVTSNLYSGLLLHPICSILAFVNEARERRRQSGEYHHPEAKYSGAMQGAVDLGRSPGIYRVALGLAFLVNSVESFAQFFIANSNGAFSSLSLIFGVAYLCGSLGNIGAARILNREYFKSLNAARGKSTENRESPAFNLVTSPGINWSITDLSFGLMTLPSLDAAGTIAATCAGVIAGVSIFAPVLFGSRIATPSFILKGNTITNWGFALVQAGWGSYEMAMVCFGWGMASLIIAQKTR
jgi:hypothetical protein